MSSSREEIKKKLMDIEDTTEVTVRFSDVDAGGIVHFRNYLIYLDDGFVHLINFFTCNAPFKDLVHKGILFPVRKVDVAYEHSAIFGDIIVVKSRIVQIGNTSFTFNHQMFRKNNLQLLAKGNCVRMIMDMQQKRLLNVLDFFSSCML
jgi:acyl-CoA thioester hydrolase